MTNSAVLLSSASRQIQRKFSVAASALKTKVIPTRHSRHAPPPACLSSIQLNEVTQEVLETPPGLLIPYKTSARDDSFHAWQVADHSIQKVEWLIRGLSAQINDSIMNKLYSVESEADPAQCIVQMQNLMKKMEKEGKLYMDLRHKMRSQLAVEAGRQLDDDDKDDADETDKSADAQIFASPGQTIGMFDTLLDSLAVSTGPDTPALVGELFRIVDERFEQDGGLSFNVNPNTVPTQLTYNAGLRAIANSPNNSEKTRDDAIVHAFATFDALQDTHLKRNAATFAYMIQTVARFLPPSELSGNIAHAMWLFATDDQVVDDNVMRALEMVDTGGYPKYETFLQDHIRGKTIHDLPHSWRKLGRSLRYSSSDDTY
ncbi:hypothetical protein MHU86_10532 [Fragilaria crotonensis]|nr:hypothetical protein MHU86_10532 [Fragilaria crotonensis]